MIPFGSTTLGDGVTGSAPTSHVASHARLLRAAPPISMDVDRQRRNRPDAIVVPASRPASALAGIIDRAAALQATIVVLCSGQAKIDQVADRIGRVIGARGIVAQIDQDHQLPDLTFDTSRAPLTSVSAGRSSNLSVKRNVGLLLARLHGWRKIAFVDDDITVSAQDLARLGHQLDHHQIAGMACREFADNSVFCHARRLAQLPQDVFVTGAVLGVNCSDVPLPFFADIYNEDWFFFAEAAAHRRLTKVGEARQSEYDPYGTPARARHEEFGDLLAEGLYALLEKLHSPTDLRHRYGFFPAIARYATEKYWTTFSDVRRTDLMETRLRLEKFSALGSCSDQVVAAMESLEAAEERYNPHGLDPITPQHCVDFLDALQCDIDKWNKVYQRSSNVASTDDAMKRLGIETWVSVRRGGARHSDAASNTPKEGAARVSSDEDGEVPVYKVVMSYRREDSKGLAGRIFDRLNRDIGRGRVFMDVYSIEPGTSFGDEIRRALHSCTVLVVLIGPRWLESTDGRGRRQLDDPKDLVVTQVGTALERGVRIIPVLVDGAEMPTKEDLPPDISGLAEKQSVSLNHGTFRQDSVSLLRVVRRAT